MKNFLLSTSLILFATAPISAQSDTPAAAHPGCSYQGVDYGEGSRVQIGSHYYRCTNGSWQNDDAPSCVSLLGLDLAQDPVQMLATDQLADGALEATPALAAGPTFSFVTFANLFPSCRMAKKNKAVEFKSSDSNYRIWEPTVSSTPGGGLLVSFKVDHIRRFAHDDHAAVEIEFDSAGNILSASSSMQLAGQQAIDSRKVAAAGALVGTPVTAWVATEVTNAFLKVAQHEHGGRANFPAVVKHAINHAAASVSR